jgi:AcrR family transcriptional regulator
LTATKSRRRGAELEQAILEAAWAELKAVGYSALTIEAVAARAGTGKTVIYRRWSSRAELVIAAWSKQVPMPPERPNTGALRSDLIALFTTIARRVDTMMSELVAGVMGEAFRHPEVIALLRERLKTAPLLDVVQTIVQRAVDRGELRAAVTLSNRAVHVPLDLIRNEAMVFGAPIGEEAITELVDDVYLPLLRGLSQAPVSA